MSSVTLGDLTSFDNGVQALRFAVDCGVQGLNIQTGALRGLRNVITQVPVVD